MSEASEAFRAFLVDLKVAKTKIDDIVERFETYEPGEVRAVLPTSARAAIETVEVYGLAIGVDANGRAARVELAGQGTASTTDGFDVEYWD